MEDTSVNPFIRHMLSARRIVLAVLLSLILMWAVLEYPQLAFAAAIGILVVAISLVWCFIFLAARREAGAGYAWRHLLLTVLLTPVFLIGVLAVPALVKSELKKRRQGQA